VDLRYCSKVTGATVAAFMAARPDVTVNL
jgi:Ca2+/Na+ antiporter